MDEKQENKNLLDHEVNFDQLCCLETSTMDVRLELLNVHPFVTLELHYWNQENFLF